MGMNGYNGGPPFPAPTAFWWKLPDGRRTFVYLAEGYYQASGLFLTEGSWRVGDSPSASDLAFRPPRAGEMLKADEASVLAAHDHCLKSLAQLENRGYVGDRLIALFQNQWRGDNEVPFIPITDFVATWNRLKLQPDLRLVTASQAMATLEKEIGDRIPEYEGVWPDWWSNGVPAAPRELAASRFAKRFLLAAASPVFGPMDANAKVTSDDILADLARFEEHTIRCCIRRASPRQLRHCRAVRRESIVGLALQRQGCMALLPACTHKILSPARGTLCHQPQLLLPSAAGLRSLP